MNNFNPNMDMMPNQNMNNFNPSMDMMPNQNTNNFNSNMDMMPNQNMNNFNPNMDMMPNQNMNNFNPNMDMMPNQNMNNFNPNMDMMTNQNVETNAINSVNASSNNESNDTFFVSSSDQTPKFEPREVVIPKPVETTPIMNNPNASNNLSSMPTAVVEPTAVHPVGNAPVEVPNSINNTMVPPTINLNNNEVGVSPITNNTSNMDQMQNPNVNVMQQPMPSAQQPVSVSTTMTPNVNLNEVPTPGNVTTPNISTPNIPSGVETPSMSSPQMNDANVLQGGIPFVVGNPTQSVNNQVNPGNDNWKL